MHTHCMQKIALSWFNIAEKQITARDLLMVFSRDRLCMTAAFCISANSCTLGVEYMQQHPLPALVYAVTVNLLSLFSFVL